MADGPSETLVMGVGNLLWADEGFGVRCIEALSARYDAPAGVRLLDGGTQGLYLTPLVQAADNLLVFDAIDYGDRPGTLRVLRDAEVPKFGGVRKMSLHQTGFQDVLELADMLGDLPENLVLVGVQADNLDDWGGSLSPAVSDQIEPALAIALEELARWNVHLSTRDEPRDSAASPLHRERYERAGG